MMAGLIHPESVLGRILAEEEAIQAQRQVLADLVAQRRQEMTEVHNALEAVPVHTDDVRAVADLLSRGDGLSHLLTLAEREAKRLTGEADKVRERVGLIGDARANRLREEIALLSDDTRAAPLSPIERRAKLWEVRYKLAVLEASPDEAAAILQEVEEAIPDPERRRAMLADLEGYRRDLSSLVGFPVE
jgi:hypothetical protein